MITLLTGGSKCGKSSIAEGLLNGSSGEKYYIAAMEPYGEEAQRAIARHREMRSGKGFHTIERARNLDTLKLPETGGHCCALLECLTTLCANEMFTQTGVTDPTEKIISGLKNLSGQVSKLVIVTNEVASDGVDYPSETMDYIRIMTRLNAAVAELSDTVIECICGIPLTLKGAPE